MRYDSSWNALLKPGDSQLWFEDVKSIKTIPCTADYSPSLAWLLSEVSRLCYLDPQAQPALLTEALGRAHLALVDSMQTGALKCLLLESQNPTQHRFKILAFRGTSDIENWLTNLQVLTTRWDTPTAATHRGFTAAFFKLWVKIQPRLHTSTAAYYYTGHSLGAALATLAAAQHPPTALYTYGSPRVGNHAFAESVTQAAPVFRIVNHCDLVPSLPWAHTLSPFAHTGECHYLDHTQKRRINPNNMDIFWTQLKRNAQCHEVFNYKKMAAPVKALSDHSPINYSYALANELNEQ